MDETSEAPLRAPRESLPFYWMLFTSSRGDMRNFPFLQLRFIPLLRWFSATVSVSFIMLGIAPSGMLAQHIENYGRIHDEAVVVDTHNDVVQRMLNGEDISIRTGHGHSDLPRFKEGGVDVQVFSIWVPPDQTGRSYFEQANEQIDSIVSLVRRNPATTGMARTSSEVETLLSEGKFVAMLGLEGGHPIENDIHKLEHFYRRGVRYMTLTWNNSTDWASSAKDETNPASEHRHRGLSELGKQIVRKMNDLGMMVDVSHVGEKTFWDVIKITRKPIIASHSSAWALAHNRRNLTDAQLKAIAKTGGVVCINFNPGFIDSAFPAREKALLHRNAARIDSFKAVNHFRNSSGRELAVNEFLRDQYKSIRPPLKILIDHFDYVAKLIGVDHVGIGSDFDGINVTPLDMDDVTYLPNITRELLRRGYSPENVKKILGENFLRVLRANERN